MSIHMHDLQVQNKITSKNSIETELLFANDRIITPVITANNMYIMCDTTGDQSYGGSLTFGKKEVVNEKTITSTVFQMGFSGSGLVLDIYESEALILQKTIKDENQQQQTYVAYLGIDDEGNLTTTTNHNLILHTGNAAALTGEWNIHAYPRFKPIQPDPQGVIIRSVLLESNSSYDDDSSARISQDLQVYQLENNDIILRVSDLALGDDIGDKLSTKTMNIAGLNVNIWGGTLNANNLAQELEKAGINATTAKKLVDDTNNNLNAGSSTTPVYFNNGIPMECTSLGANKLELHNEQGTIMSLLINPNLKYSYAEYYLPPDPEMGSGATTPILLSSRYIKGEQNYIFGFDDYPDSPSDGQIFFKLNTTQNGWVEATPYVYIQN